VSKSRKLARMTRPPARGVKNWLAPAKPVDTGRLKEHVEFVATPTQARRASKSMWATLTPETPIGTWDTSHRPAPGPTDEEQEADLAAAWVQRVAAAGEVIEDVKARTGRDLGGYEEIFAAPRVEPEAEPEETTAGGLFVHLDAAMKKLSTLFGLTAAELGAFSRQPSQSMDDRDLLAGAGVGRPSRILITGQEDQAQDGVYIAGGGKWTRRGDQIPVSGKRADFILIDEYPTEPVKGFRPLTTNRK